MTGRTTRRSRLPPVQPPSSAPVSPSSRAATRRVALRPVAVVRVASRCWAVQASEFFAGYLLEESLSVDNLFVFVLLFSYFKARSSVLRAFLVC